MDATLGDQFDIHEDPESASKMRTYVDDFEEDTAQIIESLSNLRIDDPRDHFPLGDLPQELVLEINMFLPGSASLTLAATCRDMRALIPKVSHEDAISWKIFAEHIDRDALASACESEVNSDDHTMRACIGCKTLHSVEHFFAVQLLLSPRARKCRHREGLLYFDEGLLYFDKTLLYFEAGHLYYDDGFFVEWNPLVYGKDGVSWDCLRRTLRTVTTRNPHCPTLANHREKSI